MSSSLILYASGVLKSRSNCSRHKIHLVRAPGGFWLPKRANFAKIYTHRDTTLQGDHPLTLQKGAMMNIHIAVWSVNAGWLLVKMDPGDVPNPAGGWEIEKGGQKKSVSHHEHKDKAIKRGAVRVKNIRVSYTLTAKMAKSSTKTAMVAIRIRRRGNAKLSLLNF